MRIRWSLPAIRQLTSIRAYIARDNPAAANRVGSDIMDAVDRLAIFPRMGRQGRNAGFRELVIPRWPYLVAYKIVDDVILVFSVVHASRRWPDGQESN
jgi:toxin ParE1/3/4